MQFKHAILGLLALGVTAVAFPLREDASMSVNVTEIFGTKNLHSLGHLEERRLNLTKIFGAENGTENSHSLGHLGHPTKRPLRHLEKRYSVKVSCKAFCEGDKAVEEVCNGPCKKAKNDRKEKLNKQQRLALVKILWPEEQDWDSASKKEIKKFILANLPSYWQKNQNPYYYEDGEEFADEYGTIDEELDEEADEELEEQLDVLEEEVKRLKKCKGKHNRKGKCKVKGKGGKPNGPYKRPLY